MFFDSISFDESISNHCFTCPDVNNGNVKIKIQHKGKVFYIENLDCDRFCLLNLLDKIRATGINAPCLKLAYKEPFSGCIIQVEEDWDLVDISKYIPAYKEVDFFVEEVDCLVSTENPLVPPPEYDPPTIEICTEDEDSCTDSLVDEDYMLDDEEIPFNNARLKRKAGSDNVQELVNVEQESRQDVDEQSQQFDTQYYNNVEFEEGEHFPQPEYDMFHNDWQFRNEDADDEHEEGDGGDVQDVNEAENEVGGAENQDGDSELSRYDPEPTGELGDSDISEAESLRSLHSSDTDDDNIRHPVFYKEKDMNNPVFQKGMLFDTTPTLRKAIREYSIIHRKKIRLVVNDRWRIRAKCQEPCKWLVYASRFKKKEETMQIKTLVDKHVKCRPAFTNHNIKAPWLAKHYLEHIRSNPLWPFSAFIEQVKRDFGVKVSRSQVYNARSIGNQLVSGTHKKQYALLYRYCLEIKEKMPGSVMSIFIDPKSHSEPDPRFLRIYTCLAPLRKGFLTTCRPILGLDGCFLKGPYPGQLLSATGIDANNGIYPMAWAVVEKETKDTWIWFLEKLCLDIGVDQDTTNFTFMCDQQKVSIILHKCLSLVPCYIHFYLVIFFFVINIFYILCL